MPIFDYVCERCRSEKSDVLIPAFDARVLCDECGVDMTKMPSVPNMHLFPIDGIHLKHVCAGGKTFHSKVEMEKYAKENNVELGALL